MAPNAVPSSAAMFRREISSSAVALGRFDSLIVIGLKVG
jgi:hypothetical protein